MARYLFAGGPADVVVARTVTTAELVNSSNVGTGQFGRTVAVPNTAPSLTVWNARTAGTQITDLLDTNEQPTNVVIPTVEGRVLFWGPDGNGGPFWLDDGVNSRWLVGTRDYAAWDDRYVRIFRFAHRLDSDNLAGAAPTDVFSNNAPAGSTHHVGSDSVGAYLWVKHQSGNPGAWKVGLGDTGDRNVTPSAGSVTSLTLRRAGDTVELNVDGWNPGSSGTVTLYTLPAGFRPARKATILWNDNGTLRHGSISSAGVVQVLSVSSTGPVSGTFEFLGSRGTWPTSLPGTAA